MNRKIFISLLFSSFVFSQSPSEKDDPLKMSPRDRMEQIFKEQRRMFDALIQDNKGLDKQIENMFERLRKGGAFKNFKNDMWGYQNSAITTYWKEDKDSKTLIIEADTKKDNVNIDIKDGLIKISGQKKIEKKVQGSTSFSSFTFSNTISVPRDVDESSVKFDSKKGIISLKFLKHHKVKKKKYKKLKGKVTI